MEANRALEALAALAHPTRLEVFRLLMSHEPEGMCAGALAERLGVPSSTLSSHLAQLERAALLRSRRKGRQIFYAVNVEGTRELLTFLTEDCCRGHPELCFGPPGTARSCEPTPRPAGVKDRAG